MIVSFFEAYWEIIKGKYEEGLFCSERHFQAELFHLLYSDKKFKKRYNLFVEPIIYDKEAALSQYQLQGIIPDMIATEKDRIVAIIELKYVPHGFVSFEKDIRNMARFYKAKDMGVQFYLRTDKKTGAWDYTRPFYLDKDIVLIYGLIGHNESYCITNPNEIWDEKYTALSMKPRYAQFIGAIDPVNEKTTFTSIISCG
ncbi:MAG TPA: hypothetical protein VI731_09320 [Bacteroidia bacterium]|nr:hypothetical protein [Bacteroidia bacterium]